MNTSAHELRPDISMETLGNLLHASNHPVRSLINGVMARSQGPLELAHVEQDLRAVGFDRFQPLTTVHIEGFIRSIPDNIMDKKWFDDVKVIDKTALTASAAALGGLLLDNFGTMSDASGLQRLVGSSMTSYQGEEVFPGTATRFVIFKYLLRENGVSISTNVKKAVDAIGAPRGSMAAQIIALERDGYLSISRQKGTRPNTLHLQKRSLVRKYTETVNDFLVDPATEREGGDRIAAYIDPKDAASKDTPYFVKNAVMNSGSPEPKVLEEFRRDLRKLYENGVKLLTVKELADEFDTTIDVINNRLRRLQKEESSVISKISKKPGGRKALVKIQFPSAIEL